MSHTKSQSAGSPPGEPPPTASPPANGWRRWMAAPRVFIPAAAIIVGFVVLTGLFTDGAVSVVQNLHEGIVASLGWYFIVLVAAFVIFAIVLAFGRFGDIKLGRDDDEPEFSRKTWLSMLFAAGMGIGLVFFGVAEPISHLANPPPGSESAAAAGQAQADLWYTQEGMTNQAADAAERSLIQTFLHWGIHPWAIYVIVGIAIAYAVHRKGRPVSIRWALEPVLGRHVRGWLGDLIDIVAIVGTLFGVATSLALGALQLAAGMGVIWGFDAQTVVQVALICGITLIATLSVVTGIRRGIKWLSQFNVSLAGVLVVFVLIAGPTLYVLREFIQSTGLYLQNLPELSFYVGADRGQEGQQWTASWTTFYWGWWISWSPFVGIFIARISRGRTVREFVSGVLLVPTVLSFLWFSVLGGTALYREVYGNGGLVDVVDGAPVISEESALFGMLEPLPAGTAVGIGVLVLIALFFVTSSDSGSFVIDMLASGGDPEPPTWSRVFWALLEGAVAISLLLMVGSSQGLASLQTSVTIAALPVSVVLIAMCLATWRQFSRERLVQIRIERQRRAEQLTEYISQHMAEQGYLAADRLDGDGRPLPAQRGGRMQLRQRLRLGPGRSPTS